MLVDVLGIVLVVVLVVVSVAVLVAVLVFFSDGCAGGCACVTITSTCLWQFLSLYMFVSSFLKQTTMNQHYVVHGFASVQLLHVSDDRRRHNTQNIKHCSQVAL